MTTALRHELHQLVVDAPDVQVIDGALAAAARTRRRRRTAMAVSAAAVTASVVGLGLAAIGHRSSSTASGHRRGSVAPAGPLVQPTSPDGYATNGCTASQLIAPKGTFALSASTLGTGVAFIIQPVHNVGATCTFTVPRTVEVATATGPFTTVEVNRGPMTSYPIRRGATITVMVRVTWRLGNPMHRPPDAFPPVCAQPVDHVTRVAIPLAAGDLRVVDGGDLRVVQVCVSPTNTDIIVTG